MQALLLERNPVRFGELEQELLAQLGLHGAASAPAGSGTTVHYVPRPASPPRAMPHRRSWMWLWWPILAWCAFCCVDFARAILAP